MNEDYWYLASPYSKYPEGLEAAHRHVCIIRGALTRVPIPAYSPIAETHPVAIYSGMDPLDHKIWLPDYKPKMRHACGLIVAKMPTWEISFGISEEIKEFTKMQKPILYLDWPADDKAIGRLIGDMGRSKILAAEGACCG